MSIRRISTNYEGDELPSGLASESSYFSSAAFSADGRFVFFHSSQPSIDVRDTNTHSDVFRYDTVTGITELVSLGSDNQPASASSFFHGSSADGRFVAFASYDATLSGSSEADTTNKKYYVRDIALGTTLQIDLDGIQVFNDALSPDGRFFLFASDRSDLVPADTNEHYDVFLYDLETGETTRVSTSSNNQQMEFSQFAPLIGATSIGFSDSGQHVLFRSSALVPPARFGSSENLYSKEIDTSGDLQLGELALIASRPSDVEPDRWGDFLFGDLSADGSISVFTAYHFNPDENDLTTNVFVRDDSSGLTTRITNGQNTNGQSRGSNSASISSDGRFVAFSSWATDLVEDDNNTFADVFVYDRYTGQTELVSTGLMGAGQNDGDYPWVQISGDGRSILFQSDASTLVPQDTNEASDLFIADNPLHSDDFWRSPIWQSDLDDMGIDMPVYWSSYKDHGGIDFTGQSPPDADGNYHSLDGVPVHAAADGFLYRAAIHPGLFGELVVLDHGNGIYSLYAHLSGYSALTEGFQANPETGAYPEVRVSQGDIIGFVGATGSDDYFPHLHFSVLDLSSEPSLQIGRTGYTNVPEGAYAITNWSVSRAEQFEKLHDFMPEIAKFADPSTNPHGAFTGSDAITQTFARASDAGLPEVFSFEGHIDPAIGRFTDVDAYRFTPFAGQTYRIDVEGAAVRGFRAAEDISFRLLASDGETPIAGTGALNGSRVDISHDPQKSKETFVVTAPTNDPFYIVVMDGGDANEADIGGYTLNIERFIGPQYQRASESEETLTLLPGTVQHVYGTASELNNDTIENFDTSDELHVIGSRFAKEDVRITYGSAILDIDTDGDSVFDTNIVLTGDFEAGEFLVQTAGEATTLRYVGSFFGTDQNDSIVGNSGNNNIEARAGNDTISGQQGDDTIDGGNGADIASYGGASNDYLVELVDAGVQITDNRVGGGDGRDLLTDIEYLQFADGLFELDQILYPNGRGDLYNTGGTSSGSRLFASILESFTVGIINRGDSPYDTTPRSPDRGTVNTPFRLDVYLSRDDTLDGTDLLLGAADFGPMAWNEKSSGFVRFNLPENVEEGVYSIIKVIDPENRINEVDETNNVRVVGDITVFAADVTKVIDNQTPNLLNGTAGRDWIFAGADADWINPGGGSDTIDGGEGRDMVSFVNLPDTPGRTFQDYRLDIDLGAGTAVNHTGSEQIQLINVERITGTIHADRIRGSDGDDQLRGSGDYDWFIATQGADTLDGGNGKDMVSYLEWLNTDANQDYDFFNDSGVPPMSGDVTGVVVDLNDTGNNTHLAAGHTYVSIERITGSGRQDVFYGDGESNDFRGLGDYDWFVGSAGGRERYFGGDGVDTVTYFRSTSGVTANLRNGATVNGQETGYGTQGDAARDLYFEIENLIGTNFDDSLTGNGGRNQLSGLDGDDMLFGYGGIDQLKGGAGNDTLNGGGSSDYAIFSGDRAEYTITKTGARSATVSSAAEGTDTLLEMEYLRFADGDVAIWDL